MNRHSGPPAAGPPPSMAPARAGENGFTLIELVIAIVVTAILSVMFARLTTSSVDMYDFIRTRKNAIHSSRMALQRISRELRQIAASDSIQYADVDSLAFYKKNGQLITLAWAGKTLRLNGQPSGR
ncbi:MAG: prepilin-type N-terminal cleavage/methylation domain-containing protein [candidate division KSB1 bacterium]|nr:prepilin-type N-terminal cleavage/methylation domain-containing protein [candidate division KSB1 bacterium]